MTTFHQYRLSNQAIQTINRIQLVLQRFPVAERVSILKYLQAGASTTNVGGNVSGLFSVSTGGVAKKGRWAGKRAA